MLKKVLITSLRKLWIIPRYSDLNVGKKIELPLWLASQLGEFVLHDIPKQYRTKFQDILASDPEVVNLHREGPKYYGMGLRVS